MTPKLFSELGLSPELLKAIDKLGFEQASPIQAAAIPILMQGKDVVGQSQTGSGKTAAFAVPAIEKINTDDRSVQVLVLCPTRELAVQVSEEVHKLGFFKRGLHALPIYGGQSYDRQLFGLRQGAQFIIGTPGRVMDHMRRGTLKLETLKMVILDEVDVMLNMGFRDDIELILQSTPKERQTVFFSATIPKPIQYLIEKYVRDPQQVRIEQKALTVPTVQQTYFEVDRRYKIELLTRLIDLHDLKLGIIFCNTKRMVDDLVDHLNAQGYSADRLHGDMSQMMRDRVMQKFRRSGLEFLVATDVAARGIDVDDVEVVFNYDLPYDGEDYVHRIGRTGRKGRSGRAISFASGREVFQIRNIERYTNTRIERGKPPTMDEVDEARTNVFLEKIRTTLKTGDFKRQDQLVERLLEEGFTTTDIASALLHLLQGGEGTPAAKAPQQEEYVRPEREPYRQERAPFRERRDDRREERREPYRDRRDDRGEPPRERMLRRTERPLLPSSTKRPEPAPRRDAPRDTRPPWREERAPKFEARKPEPPVKRPAPAPPAPVKAETQPASQPEDFGPPEVAPRKEPQVPKDKPKASRRTPEGQTRLWMSVGETQGVEPGDVVTCIQGMTGLPAKVVGTVDVREKHLFVDVAAEHANSIIAKLNRAQIKNHKLKVKVA